MQKMNGDNGKLAIAIQRPKNRGFDKVKTLLDECRISFEPKSEGLVPTSNPNFNVVLLPPKDIPKYVMQGVALGISGEDMILESGAVGYRKILEETDLAKTRNRFGIDSILKMYDKPDVLNVRILSKLGIEPVSVIFAAAKDMDVREDWKNDMRIGTSLPNIAEILRGSSPRFERATIIPLDGALENAIALGVVDAIVDQKVTGNSLRRAGLAEFAKIMDSECCLIANEKIYQQEKARIKPLKTMMESIINAKGLSFVVFNAPPSTAEGIAKAIKRGEIPCGESPTKMPLVEKGAFAYSILVKDKQDGALMSTIGKLEALGARDIVVSEVRSYTSGQVIEGTRLTVDELYSTILDRVANPKPGSSTNELISSREKLGAKIVEEAGELYEAAFKDQGKYRIASEGSDVLYAFLVGCAASGFKKETVLELFGDAQRGELNEFRRFDLQGGAAAIKEELGIGNMSTGTAAVFLANVNEALVQQGIALEEVVR